MSSPVGRGAAVFAPITILEAGLLPLQRVIIIQTRHRYLQSLLETAVLCLVSRDCRAFRKVYHPYDSISFHYLHCWCTVRDQNHQQGTIVCFPHVVEAQLTFGLSEQVESMSCQLVVVIDYTINGTGILKRAWRDVEYEKSQVKHFSSIWIEHVYLADLLSSLSAVNLHRVWCRYSVLPDGGGVDRSTSGHGKLLIVLAVLIVNEWCVQVTAEISHQF